jgi:serine/threonine protein kinase
MRLGWRTACLLGRQMLKSLQQMHDAGYIHRDVKPSNFALGRAEQADDKLYIIDFGLARKVRERAQFDAHGRSAVHSSRSRCPLADG